MTLRPVQSTMIASVGYDYDLKHLRAVMKSGTIYDVAPCTSAEYDAFLQAPSIGVYWLTMFKGRAVKSGTTDGVPIRLREPAKTAVQTFVPDPCCVKPLTKAIRSGSLDTAELWKCPNCGCDWHPRMVGTVRHWEPNELATVMRL